MKIFIDYIQITISLPNYYSLLPLSDPITFYLCFENKQESKE